MKSTAELMDEALKLPTDRPEAVAAWTTVVDAAEREKSEYGLKKGLEKLCESAIWTGLPDRALVSLARLVAFHDQRETGSDHALLWSFKWVLEHLPAFSQIPPSRAEGLLADFAQRLDAAGRSPRTKWMYRASQAGLYGRYEEAVEATDEALTHPRDGISDCRACEVNHLAHCQFDADQLERAMETAAPILERRLRCAEVPHVTLAVTALARARLGDWEGAERDQRVGYRLVRNNPKLIPTHTLHIVYATAAGRLTRGLDMFERAFRDAHESPVAGYRLRFYLAGAYLFERMIEAGDAPLKVRVPRSYPDALRGERTPSRLRDSLRLRIEEEEAAFGASGNPYPSVARRPVEQMRPVQRTL